MKPKLNWIRLRCKFSLVFFPYADISFFILFFSSVFISVRRKKTKSKRRETQLFPFRRPSIFHILFAEPIVRYIDIRTTFIAMILEDFSVFFFFFSFCIWIFDWDACAQLQCAQCVQRHRRNIMDIIVYSNVVHIEVFLTCPCAMYIVCIRNENVLPKQTSIWRKSAPRNEHSATNRAMRFEWIIRKKYGESGMMRENVHMALVHYRWSCECVNMCRKEKTDCWHRLWLEAISNRPSALHFTTSHTSNDLLWLVKRQRNFGKTLT